MFINTYNNIYIYIYLFYIFLNISVFLFYKSLLNIQNYVLFIIIIIYGFMYFIYYFSNLYVF